MTYTVSARETGFTDSGWTASGTITVLATLQGQVSGGGGGIVEPTSGLVTFHVCYSASARPTVCDASTWDTLCSSL